MDGARPVSKTEVPNSQEATTVPGSSDELAEKRLPFGGYVYGDFCSGRIWGYDPTSEPGAPIVVELAELANLTAIAVGGEGDLFAVSNTGTVSRFSPA